ncbi:hypothetical protein DSL72_000762 [Monilinia vaccinii-corymbosi]|uniref:Uncharacterized protein n=1 Tax=Monilinia vaccinii-corymbosi TaxID=61207 RepID=A0A8A3P9R3_9HELO|nr:hypothetical protein DSL72_000762 [Monilinia vaccinii-corymbosi]
MQYKAIFLAVLGLSTTSFASPLPNADAIATVPDVGFKALDSPDGIAGRNDDIITERAIPTIAHVRSSVHNLATIVSENVRLIYLDVSMTLGSGYKASSLIARHMGAIVDILRIANKGDLSTGIPSVLQIPAAQLADVDSILDDVREIVYELNIKLPRAFKLLLPTAAQNLVRQQRSVEQFKGPVTKLITNYLQALRCSKDPGLHARVNAAVAKIQ